MLVNRDLAGRFVRAGLHRWLPASRSVRAGLSRWLPLITNSSVPRRPLMIATALTAAAAVAAGSTPAPQSTQPVPAASAQSGSTVANTAQSFAHGLAAPAAAAAPAAKGAAKPNKAAKAPGKQKHRPSDSDLMPLGAPGGQSAFAPSREQVRNAKQIVRTGERMKMPPRAQVIAVATALQESKLENLGHLGAANDHDSLGLFQQRPSSGWGTPAQVTDPNYAAEQFYRGLAQVPGYQDLPLSAAAQTVQVSAFPDAYAQWEKMGADLVLAAHDTGPYAGVDH